MALILHLNFFKEKKVRWTGSRLLLGGLCFMKTPQMTIKSDKRKKSQERSSCYQVISYLEDSVTDPGLQKKPEMAFPLIKKKKKIPSTFQMQLD